ncbi:MAG TPA: response regulator [Pyrinomonadaceae bacterium]|nr:response regulator [Pyrinomonadaceae bacterium]
MTKNIIAVVDDIFFASKIRGTAEQVGVAVAFARSADGVSEIIQQQAPSLIICDLHSQKINPIELAKSLKAKEGTRDIPLLGFFSHVQTELQRRAQDAGFDRVIPRSAFATNLVEILRGA